MTSVMHRIAPSPVPLAQRTAPRDTTGNVWVRRPDECELGQLFGDCEWVVAEPVRLGRRPAPSRVAA